MDDPVWDEGKIAQRFFARMRAEAAARGLLSDEHFTVDSTLLEAWASLKSFRRRDQEPPSPPDDPGNPTVDFRGERRSNTTHASTTDPEARLARRGDGREARLAYQGHVLMENRHGLVVAACVTPATGTAEREAAVALVHQVAGRGRTTLGADKSYDTAAFVEVLRRLEVTPHVAQQTRGRASAIDARTTRHPGYALSQRKRRRIAEIFGWLKTVGLLRKVRHHGRAKVHWLFVFAAAIYNLVRIRNVAEVAG